MNEQTEQEQCKYCYETEGTMIRPCNCTAPVHLECLERWVHRGPNAQLTCEICLARHNVIFPPNRKKLYAKIFNIVVLGLYIPLSLCIVVGFRAHPDNMYGYICAILYYGVCIRIYMEIVKTGSLQVLTRRGVFRYIMKLLGGIVMIITAHLFGAFILKYIMDEPSPLLFNYNTALVGGIFQVVACFFGLIFGTCGLALIRCIQRRLHRPGSRMGRGPGGYAVF